MTEIQGLVPFRWGSSLGENVDILGTPSADVGSGNQPLYYFPDVKYLGRESLLRLQFRSTHDDLVSANFLFLSPFNIYENGYIKEYGEVTRNIWKLAGRPAVAERITKDTRPKLLDLSIRKGELALFTGWQTPHATISQCCQWAGSRMQSSVILIDPDVYGIKDYLDQFISDLGGSKSESRVPQHLPLGIIEKLFWNMRRDESVAILGEPEVQETVGTRLYTIYSPIDLSDFPALLRLGFNTQSDGLETVSFFLLQRYVDDPGGYLIQYGRLKEWLTAKYGQPTVDDILHRTKSLPIDGNSLEGDKIGLFTAWDLNGTNIVQRLSRQRFGPQYVDVWFHQSESWSLESLLSESKARFSDPTS